MQDIHELRMLACKPELGKHPVKLTRVHLEIGRMAAPEVDLLGIVFCFNKHGNEQV